MSNLRQTWHDADGLSAIAHEFPCLSHVLRRVHWRHHQLHEANAIPALHCCPRSRWVAQRMTMKVGLRSTGKFKVGFNQGVLTTAEGTSSTGKMPGLTRVRASSPRTPGRGRVLSIIPFASESFQFLIFPCMSRLCRWRILIRF